MKSIYKFLFVLLLLAPAALVAQTKKFDARRAEEGFTLPTWGLKTNLIADATTSPSLAFEIRTGGHTSIDIYGEWNPFTFRGGKTFVKHWLVQPEFRYWLKETFRGSFFGLHGHYAQYNIGGLWNGPFTDYMYNNRFQGWLAGAGISWGYRWNFARHFGMEFTIGAGFAYIDAERFDCVPCGEKLGDVEGFRFAPTKLGLSLIFGAGSRDTKPAYVPQEVVVVQAYNPTIKASFITPEADPAKVRQESGKAYLEYEVGRSTILPNFRGNAAELAKINSMIQRVKSDSDATITGISLTGHASPEGTQSSNQSLSERRAEALKEYVAKTDGIAAGIMTARGAGEDWTTLAELVSASSVADKAAVLDVVRSSEALDPREAKMRAIGGGAPYKAIKAEMYPKLRRTDYVLDYTIAPISVERGKQILHTNPGNLSLNELFRIADTYAPGSSEYREVQEIAARTYPNSDIANINAAAATLQHGDLAAAARFLENVKDRSNQVYLNNMGVMAWARGEKEEAANFFRRAGSAGSDNAAEIAKHFSSIPE